MPFSEVILRRYDKVLPLTTRKPTARLHADATGASTPALRPVTVKLEASVKARLQRLAQARQRTPHWLMHQAIVQFVGREEKREEFHRDALAAWEEFRLTGAHVSAHEADAWMTQLEEGLRAEPPAPHP